MCSAQKRLMRFCKLWRGAASFWMTRRWAAWKTVCLPREGLAWLGEVFLDGAQPSFVAGADHIEGRLTKPAARQVVQ